MTKNKSEEKNKKASIFHNIFYNNKYLAIFSFVAAAILWIVVVMAFSPETTYKIKDVPIVIDVENSTAGKLNLQPFTENELKVDVTVEGKRYSITQRDISADDISVTVNLNYIDSVGTHSLQLIPKKNNPNADYEIVDLSIDEIEVYFDAYKEVEIDLKTEEIPKTLIKDEYFVDGAVLSENTVTVCGAAMQINKLDEENIYAKISDNDLKNIRTLEKTISFNSVIDLVDANGNKINYIKLKDTAPVVITIPVMQRAEFATGVEFSNTPENYNDFIESISITPQTVKIGATEDVIASMTQVVVGNIDFSQIKSGKNTFKFKKENFSSNLKIFDDINEVTVIVNVFDATSKKVNVENSSISFINVPENYTVSLFPDSSAINGVTVYGAESVLSSLTSDSVYAVVDMSGYDGKTGNVSVVAKVSVKNQNCWAYGTYKIPINIVKK